MEVRIIHDVPASEVEAYRKLAKAGKGTLVESKKESDGEFTLVIVFPSTPPVED